jgi:hypothetical protein
MNLGREFIRALVLAICRCCLDFQNGKLKLNADLFEKRISIIDKYIKNEDHQLEALNAVQTFYLRTQRSIEIFCQIIDILRETVVNKSVLIKWKLEGGGEGKAATVEALN